MTLRFLHLHSSFAPGGKELRAAKLMTAFGTAINHTVVSAVPGHLGAGAAIGPEIAVSYPDDFPALAGRPFPRRLQRLAEAMRGFDLILSYNWGAMDAALAHAVFGQRLGLPPLVHHEDGFNEDEARRLNPARNLFRRLALHRAAALVVPSQRLEHIARTAWGQPAAKVRRVANGVPVQAYRHKPPPDALPRVIKHPGELWVGTMAGLRAVKNLPRMVRAFSALPEPWHLVIVGDGPERDAIRAEAVRLNIGYRVHLPGFMPDPAKIVGLFDIFALSSESEQFPISVVEAMAAGLPVAAPAVGDIAAMLPAANAALLAAPGDEAALTDCLSRLARDAALRADLGAANQARAGAEYDEARMVETYRRIYAGAMGRRTLG